MSERKSIEKKVKDIFEFLVRDYQFKSPIVNNENSTTTFSYLHSNYAIEIELDWREYDVFVLLTQLEDGQLPSGYYIFEGKKVRLHLEEILKDDLKIAPKNINDILGPIIKHKNRNQKTVENKIRNYAVLISKHINDINKLEFLANK